MDDGGRHPGSHRFVDATSHTRPIVATMVLLGAWITIHINASTLAPILADGITRAEIALGLAAVVADEDVD